MILSWLEIEAKVGRQERTADLRDSLFARVPFIPEPFPVKAAVQP